MAITLFSDDMDIIVKLSDRPITDDGLTADQFKARFDYAGKQIKDYLNNTLIPEVAEKPASAGIVKSDASGNFSAAVPGTDYQEPLTPGTDYEAPLDADQKRSITVSAEQPSGGSDGDLWIVVS